MEAELSSEVGPAGRLFKSSVDLFWALLQRTSILNLKTAQKDALRDEFGKFYFWGDGYYPFEGRLDQILYNSSRLRYRVLSILAEVGEILCNEKKGLFALVNRNFGDAKLNRQRVDVQELIEVIRQSLEDPASSDSDADHDYGEDGELFEDVIRDLQSRNRCLMDLSASLDRPAPDADVLEKGAPVPVPFQVSGPAEIWTRKVLDTYQDINVTLAERLGEANWERYQRISKKLEIVEALDSDNNNDDDDDDDDDDLGDLPKFSEATKSTKDQSSIFSARGESSRFGTTATSVSKSSFDYSFPMARKRALAKDASSQATYTSTMSDDQGQRGWLRIPALPIKEADLGKAFRCTVCGEKLQEVMNRTDWKRHVFADLEPYICTFPDCEGGITSFQSRKAWADHEFTLHRISKSWTCSDCAACYNDKQIFRRHLRVDHGYIQLTSTQLEVLVGAAERRTTAISKGVKCPFCPEAPGVTNRAFSMHVARHMEEIALAVLPRDSDLDAEHGSLSSSQSLPAIIDDADAHSGLFNTKQEPKPPDSLPPGKEPSEPFKRIGLDHFNFLATLGGGNAGKVMLAETKESKKLYAIKVLKKELIIENDEVERVKVEKNVFWMATKEKHPFVIELIATFQTETRIYYVMEYASGGDLMYHIQRGAFGVARSLFYAAELCLVLKYLHENGIIYRDLKLENTLLAMDGHIKVMDFGCSKEGIWYGGTTKTFIGATENMAPEILLDKKYGRAVDWWAFGVILYQMVLQRSPFQGEDEDEIFDAILADEPLYPLDSPHDLVHLLSKLFIREPDERLGSGPDDALEVMRHEAFKHINWDDLYYKRVPAPFIPTIQSATDTSNFDKEFTDVTPVLTPVTSVLSQAMQEEFRGFSSATTEI